MVSRLTSEEFEAELWRALDDGTCLNLVLSKRNAAVASDAERLSARPVAIRGQQLLQLTSRIGRQERHENLSPPELRQRLAPLLGAAFLHCHLYTTEADLAGRWNREGRFQGRRSSPTQKPQATSHNRTKKYIIPEGEPCDFLAEIGVMTADGKVRAARYAKFRQINRFLELVQDTVPHLPANGRLNVVDFGSGKSYLTFALHHLLSVIHGRDTHLVGLDHNPDVIAECRRVAGRLSCRGLSFERCDIAEYTGPQPVHLAVSLHACDTATDDALVQAVGWNANVILAVPCCQHELSNKVANRELEPLLKHGILRERFAALATDALRADALERCGYRTQVLEFIDLEHTPKNLLIRAIRRGDSGDQDASANAGATVAAFKQLLGIGGFRLDGLSAETPSDEPPSDDAPSAETPSDDTTSAETPPADQA